jgi:NAD-reducing hydrogenase large subunit
MHQTLENGQKKYSINPVTRVEGHGKVTIRLDADGRVADTRFHIIEFRGFERFVQGRLYWEAPVLVQRLCGICPVSHHLCASKAMDQIAGVDQVPPSADKIRRLAHYGQTFQSHALHFFHLASPDLLFGFDAPVEKRNIIGVIRAYPDIAKKAVLMRKFGQEVIKATLGKKIHGTGSVPGGVNRLMKPEECAALRAQTDDMVAWSIEGIELCKRVVEADRDRLLAFGTFEANCLSIVGPDGALELYEGGLRARDPQGGTLFDHVPISEYDSLLREEVRPWSYMKFPYIKALGKETGWYRVGPLARVNNCDFADTPLAERERREFMALGGGRPIQSTMAYHWARLIEILHSAEKMRELLPDPDLVAGEKRATGERRPVGKAVLEAPRGTLIHHYEVDENDQITRANLIVSTTHNNEAMNRAVRTVADQYLSGCEVTEALLNHIEVGIRAYDPCLSCATHALGHMALRVELRDAGDRLLHALERGGA